MARQKFNCAPSRWPVVLSFGVVALAVSQASLAETKKDADSRVAQAQPTQEPVWLGQTPTYQVGPDGAIYLDGPGMVPGAQYGAVPPGAQYGAVPPGYPMQQPPMIVPGAAPGAAPAAAPYPYVGAYVNPNQPWGTQQVVGQPTWGQQQAVAGQGPLTQQVFGQNLLGGPIPPTFVHRHGVFGEFLYVRPRNAEVAYALPIDGPVAPTLGNEVPIGPVALVDPGYDVAFRVGGTLAVDKGSSIVAQWTRLRSEATHSVSLPGPDVLRSLVSHPLGANAATDTLDASAQLNVDLDTIDLDYRALMFGCEGNCSYAINYLVGAQFASLDQLFGSTYAVIGTTTVDTAVNFDGAGMRFGLEGERIWPKSGLFVYGTGITNILFGEFDASYVQFNTFNDVEAATSWSAGRIVPVIDFEVGAGWWLLNRHLRLSAGYRVSAWFNVVKTDDWIHAVQTNDFRDMGGTLTFDGLVGRAEWMF